ncbi:MAG: hypothetical protein R2694_20840 [Ilumatobacteraceae bacterium]
MAGDIVAGLEASGSHHRRHPVRLRQPGDPGAHGVPGPRHPHVAIKRRPRTTRTKLGKALKSLSDEDPTFRVRTDEETGQTGVISGMGELHLFSPGGPHAASSTWSPGGKPQVAYRETIARRVESVTSTAIQADRWFRPVRRGEDRPRSPNPTGGGYEFVDKISGGRVAEVHPADQPGRGRLDGGVLAGFTDGGREGHPGG